MTQADNHTRMFNPYWYPFRLFSKLQFRQLLNLEGIAHQWILPRGLQENTSTRSRGSASPVSCSRALLSALRPLNSRPWSAKMCSRYLRVSTDWTYSHINNYQYGSKRGYPWTHKKDQSLHFCVEPRWTIGVNHFQPRIEMNRQLKTLTSSNAFSTATRWCSVLVTLLQVQRIHRTELGFMTCLDMRDWNSWATSLQETAQVQASLSVSEIVPDPVTLLLDRPESSPSETKPLPSQCGSLDMGLLKRHTGTTHS